MRAKAFNRSARFAEFDFTTADGPGHPISLCHLAERLSVPQSIVSQQLRILRMRQLVASTRKNGHSLYRLTEPLLKKVIRCMESCLEQRRGRRS